MIDEKGVIERIFEVLKTRYKSINAAANAIDIRQSSLATAHSRGQVNFQILASVLQYQPDINPDWLIFGRGDMLRTVPGEEQRTAQYIAEINALRQQQKQQLDEVERNYQKDIKKLRSYE